MGPQWWRRVLYPAFLLALPAAAQVIEFEANGLRYQTLTRDGLTIMVAHLPAPVRDFSVLQVAVSNGGASPRIIKPEDFALNRDDGLHLQALPARTVVDSLVNRASRSDVIRLTTAYENGIYGNTRYKATNGYEQRRQSALAEFTSTKLRAAAAASAIAFVQTKLAPGQSTDGAVFFSTVGRPLTGGTIRAQVGGDVFEFPLVLSSQIPQP